MICDKCGNIIDDKAESCPYCGAPLNVQPVIDLSKHEDGQADMQTPPPPPPSYSNNYGGAPSYGNPPAYGNAPDYGSGYNNNNGGFGQPYYPSPSMGNVPADPNEMSIKEWLGTLLLMIVPVANFILMIIWAIGGNNVKRSKSNFFRAYWIFCGIVFAAYLLLVIVVGIFAVAFSS